MHYSFDNRIVDVLRTLYETANGGAGCSWKKVYVEIANIISAGLGAVSVFSNRTKNFENIGSNLDPDAQRQYDGYYKFISPFRDHISKMLPGDHFSRIEHYPNNTFEKTEFYQDFLRKQDIYQYEYHPLAHAAGLTGGIFFTRPQHKPTFTTRERKAIKFLIPHLQTAFQIYLTLSEAKRENMQMSELLSRISQSVVLVDRSARIVFMNNAAERIIGRKDGLEHDRNNVFSAKSSTDNKALRTSLEHVFSEKINGNGNQNGILQISRPSGLRSFQLLVAPLSEQGGYKYRSERLALIMIFDPDERAATNPSTLIQLYGLTKAEAHLATIMGRGASVNEAAEEMSVQTNTVRIHLKHIFSKTDTKKQSELIRLVTSGPANLMNNDGHYPSG